MTVTIAMVLLCVLPEIHILLEKYASRRRRRQAAPDAPPIKVVSLMIYPVKSCGGISVPEAMCTKRGFRHDRQWMVIYEATGNMLTQRQVPKMALISPEVLSGPQVGGRQVEKILLVLKAPGMPIIEIPLIYKGGTIRDVRVWDDTCPGIDQGDAAAAWLSKYMGSEAAEAAGSNPGGILSKLRLVWYPSDAKRPADSKYSPGAEAGAYSDGFPYLLVSNESLKELNARLPKGVSPLPMNRFRPNIVVEGVETPFAEDQWERIRFIKAEDNHKHSSNPAYLNMHIVKPCSRCKIPTTDQKTGEQGRPTAGESEAEPTRTLREFRSGAALKLSNVKWRDEVFFGQNAVFSGAVRSRGWIDLRWLFGRLESNEESRIIKVGHNAIVARKQSWVTWGM